MIGSGVSGLTAALVLAQKGQRVALIEKSSRIAPLIRRFKRGNFWCDPGFHYSGGFDDPGTLSVIFRYLGIQDALHPVPMNENGYDVFHMGDREVGFPVGIKNVGDALSGYFPKSKHAIDEYIHKLEYVLGSTAFLNFDLNYNAIPSDPAVNDSLEVFLRQRGAEESLVQLLGVYGQFLYGSPGRDIPFYLHAMVMGTFYRSPHTLVRGGDEIVDAFSSRLRDAGVEIFCKTPAIGIEVGEGRRLKGVRIAGGDVLECRHCVSTMHPGLLLKILPSESVRPAYLSRMKRLENTNPAFAMFLQTEAVPSELVGSNYYTLPEKGTSPLAIMACGPNADDGNKKALCVLREHDNDALPLEWQGVEWRTDRYRDYKAWETENSLSRTLAVFPELKGKCSVADSATRFTYERFTGTPGGSMYGVKQSINQAQLSSATPVKGLYLAGQSVLVPGVMSSMISGFLAAFIILDGKTLWDEIQKCR